MRIFPRTFWRCNNAEKTPALFSGECRQAYELLTAAFDGEVAEELLVKAQRHRGECAYCARHWAEWEKTRVYLCSVPAPDVPASLLTRILLACRLLSAHDAAASSLASDTSTRTKLIQYLSAVEDESVSGALNHALPPVPVPLDLHRRIVQATCHAPLAQRYTLAAFLQQLFPSISRSALRWGMGLAAPAIAVWFILAGQIENPEQLVNNTSSKTQVNNLMVAGSEAAKIPGIVADIKSIPKPLAGQVVKAAKALPGLTADAVLTQTGDNAESRAGARHVVVTANQPLESKKPEIKAAVVAARPVSLAPPLRTRTRPEPAIDLVEIHPPSMVLASSERPITRLPFHTTPKISHPSITAASPRLAHLNETDFDEAFIAVTTARDNRPAEYGQAFDEYRAALLTDPNDVEDETEEL